MELEENVELLGVDAEGQVAPQVVEIDDTSIPPDQHPIDSETDTKAAFEVPTVSEVIALAILEDPGICRSTQVRSQPNN